MQFILYMLIINLFALTINIISLIVNCNLIFTLLAKKSLIIIFMSSANSIQILFIEQFGISLIIKRIDHWGNLYIYISRIKHTVIVICKLTSVFKI